jgi:hypothetical protein
MTSLHPKKTSFPFQASHPCILQKLLWLEVVKRWV